MGTCIVYVCRVNFAFFAKRSEVSYLRAARSFRKSTEHQGASQAKLAPVPPLSEEPSHGRYNPTWYPNTYFFQNKRFGIEKIQKISKEQKPEGNSTHPWTLPSVIWISSKSDFTEKKRVCARLFLAFAKKLTSFFVFCFALAFFRSAPFLTIKMDK